MRQFDNKPAALDTTTPRETLPARAGALRRDIGKYHANPNPPENLPTNITRGAGGGKARLIAALTAFLLVAHLAPAQINNGQEPSPPPSKPQKKAKPAPENIEWLWQYTPDETNTDGRENDLVQDLRFRPLLEQYLTAPQTFWGTPIDGQPRSLATTALDHLSVPDKVIADGNRYVSIQGCVVHFCPARGLLWIDLNGQHHLVVFAAIDWAKQGRPTTDPAAEYTLWVFPDDPLSLDGPATSRVPAALTKAIARWSSQPLPGTGVVQKITHAILVDPDGTQHPVDPSALGVLAPGSKPKDDEAPQLKPRN